MLQGMYERYERDAEEGAELSVRWEERLNGITSSPRESYKQGYKHAYSMFRNPVNTAVTAIGISMVAYLMVDRGLDDLSKLKSQKQEAQAKQQRIIGFYQSHGNIPKDCVCPAYLDSRAQLWKKEVEGE